MSVEQSGYCCGFGQNTHFLSQVAVLKPVCASEQTSFAEHGPAAAHPAGRRRATRVCCGFILIQSRNFTETGPKSATVATSDFITKYSYNPTACFSVICTVRFCRCRPFYIPLESNKALHFLDLLKQKVKKKQPAFFHSNLN